MKLLKKLLPDKIIYMYRLIKINKRKHKSYIQSEQEINGQFIKVFHRSINWEDPKTYNEKLNVVKLYGNTKLKTMATDKIAVREYIKEKIGEEYLIPLLGIYDNFDDIPFDKLPNKFVIKCNHDCGSVFICNDKKKLPIKKLRTKYNNFFLKRNFAYANSGYQMQYRDIKPKIMIEKNMGDNLKDYKFLCFHGNPYYCWVDINRFQKHKRNIYDMNWKLQKGYRCKYENYEGNIKRPDKFEEMKKICRLLSKDFDHVRVDLYSIKGKIYFGELTFTSACGLGNFIPDAWDYELGKLWGNLKDNKRNELRKGVKS